MIMDIARCVTVYTAQAFARESGGDRFRVWLRCDNELRLAGPHRRRGASRRFNGAAAHEPRRRRPRKVRWRSWLGRELRACEVERWRTQVSLDQSLS